MIFRKMMAVAAFAGIVGMMYPCVAGAQETAPQGGRERVGQQGRPEGRQFDPAQMQQRFMDRIKETLQVTDEEWTVIKPKIEKVRNAQMSTQRMGMVRGRPQGEGESQAGLSPVQKTARELQTVLANKDAQAKDISARLTAYRAARDKAEKELASARGELKELLTQKQEAQLVLMGLLE